MSLLADTTTTPETQQSETTARRRPRPHVRRAHRLRRGLRARPVACRAHGVLRRRRVPAPDGPRGGLALHARRAARRPARRERRRAASTGAELPEGVTTSTITAGRRRRLGILPPQDRAGRRRRRRPPTARCCSTSRPRPSSTSPCDSSLVGQGGRAACTATSSCEAGRLTKATVVVEHTGSAALRRPSRSSSATARTSPSSRAALGRRRPAPRPARRARRSRRPYKHIAVSLGGEIVRVNANVRYAGPGGDATLLGVYFADAGQHLEHRSYVDHNAPHCKSASTYKGALQGETAHTVWVGDVLIRAGAEGTDTYELNRNLVLTDGARADSVPNLEIETGEIVGAGHASPQAVSTTCSCSTCSRAASGGRGQPARRARLLRGASARRRCPAPSSSASRAPSGRGRGDRAWSSSELADGERVGESTARRRVVRDEAASTRHDIAPRRRLAIRGRARRLHLECWLHGSRFNLAPASRPAARHVPDVHREDRRRRRVRRHRHP